MSERRSHDIQADVTLLGEAGRRSLALSAGAAVIGVSASVGLAAYSDGGWGRFFQSYLVSYTFFLSLALGVLFFVLVQHATRAGWSVVICPLAENVAANLFLPMAVLVLPILFGLRDLYEWSRPEAVAADHLLQAKAAYLNVPFFLVRTLVYFASWAFIAIWFLRRSVRQDTSGSIEDTEAKEATVRRTKSD